MERNFDKIPGVFSIFCSPDGKLFHGRNTDQEDQQTNTEIQVFLRDKTNKENNIHVQVCRVHWWIVK